MMKILALVILCTYINIGGTENVFVSIPNGKIKGTTMKSREGRNFFSFRGIPYAQPPVGNLRFKAPVSVFNWIGTLDATKDAPICLQKDYMFKRFAEIEGSEDCLFLNVYTSSTKESKNLPVIVQIHYGGFQSGNSKSTLIGPQYLLDKDVVYVSFNYRMGILGFYSTLDDASPGNYGMKDQLLALRWVQANIANFGGNPNLVTLIGMSAGAGAAHHHLLSPGSQGLFHRVIISSGTALDMWAHPLNFLQENFFKRAAQSVGCNGTTTEIVECMRKVSTKDLLNLQDKFQFFNHEPIVIFSIVQEKRSLLNPQPFLEEDTADLVRKGEFNKVPLIIGMTQDEGLGRASGPLLNEDLYDELRNDFDNLLPKILLPPYVQSQEKTSKVWKQIKEFYIKDNTISLEKPNTIKGFIDFYGDAMFIYGIYQTVLYHAYNGYKDLWMYKFEYKGEQSFRQSFASTNRTIDYDWGVCHGDDYIYLFPAPDMLPKLPSSDLKMSEIMVEIWTHFAVHGEPPKLDDGCCTLDWKRMPNIEGKTPSKNEYLNFLNITKSTEGDCPVSMKMQNGFLKDRMSFWENLDVNFQIKIK